ncbi:family 78 glycoside hydrolase catalytic domain [Zunongwangia sp. F260]|uniref:alpha-L-rhamnosidase n=1 Tax=Autumnicola lenta TaxID=3075593 RepID=A0ABU3CNQ8_9FLAO|nr:family 78 glycoside hydrolase catalytic domain [Zunongwangia sp. F260]MDT0647990.1 family 78 glycoside hydrolase catalytic domain [Zunongwangia sp. F260]
MVYKLGFLLLLIINPFIYSNEEAKIVPSQLTCEYLSSPSVVDVLQPRLGWKNLNSSQERGQKQTAYQVRVASSEDKLNNPDLWDSQEVESAESIRILYKGKKLSSRQECWWQVRVWDRDGNVSAWSKPAHWRMGILDKNEWKAKWIGAPWQGEEALPRPRGPFEKPEEYGPPAPFLRKEFELNKEVEKAVAYVTGLGYFEFYANGEKVSDNVLVPNQTNYGHRPELSKTSINVPDDFTQYKAMYLAYDITEYLKKGRNAVGSILGNGFYNPAKFWSGGYGTPRFYGQIYVTYKDGTGELIVSDESWKAAKSPILMDMVYYGEIYDAREEIPGWANVGLDDSDWKNVAIRKAPEGQLVAHTANPDKVMERIEPISIVKTGEGNYTVDFGVEISGWVRLNNVEGPAGHKIDISFISNQYSGENSYIFKGNGLETYAPRFNWFVFSAVEITNWPVELKAEHLTAEAVYTYVEESADFSTSNQLFNNINKIWRRSQVDNMHGGIVSDCPHRERNGYTGDGQVACATVIHNYDVRNFYFKWIGDMLDSQVVSTGYVPNCSPWQPGCGGGVAWGAAIAIMPWEFYKHYGALDMLEISYEPIKGYIGYMQDWVSEEGIMFSQRRGEDGELLKWFNLGEWAPPGEFVRDDLVHTFYYWRCLDIVAKMAKILGEQEEHEKFQSLAEETKKAFSKVFYDKEKGTYGDAGGDIFALKMGVPDYQYEKVRNSLVENIKQNDGHLDTGIFGTRYFFEVLAENGLQKFAYEVMNKKTEPGFGHWVEIGSTTTREHWDEGGSHNHPMFGGGLVWFYQNLAGMNADPENPGYRHIIFKPQPVDDLEYVSYKNDTPYGEAGITWRNNKHNFGINIVVPVGSTATVYIPVGDNSIIEEKGKDAETSEMVTFVKMEGRYAIYKVESGTYDFAVEENE